MQALKDLEIGVMFWGGGDPVETLREVKGLGVRCGQIGVPGEMDLGAKAREAWKSALAAEQFTLVTVFAAYNGESYADIPTVQKTVGFIPPATRSEREKRTLECSDFAAAVGAPSVATHIDSFGVCKIHRGHWLGWLYKRRRPPLNSIANRPAVHTGRKHKALRECPEAK